MQTNWSADQYIRASLGKLPSEDDFFNNSRCWLAGRRLGTRASSLLSARPTFQRRNQTQKHWRLHVDVGNGNWNAVAGQSLWRPTGSSEGAGESQRRPFKATSRTRRNSGGCLEVIGPPTSRCGARAIWRTDSSQPAGQPAGGCGSARRDFVRRPRSRHPPRSSSPSPVAQELGRGPSRTAPKAMNYTPSRSRVSKISHPRSR